MLLRLLAVPGTRPRRSRRRHVVDRVPPQVARSEPTVPGSPPADVVLPPGAVPTQPAPTQPVPAQPAPDRPVPTSPAADRRDRRRAPDHAHDALPPHARSWGPRRAR